jgi:hypothetical protein
MFQRKAPIYLFGAAAQTTARKPYGTHVFVSERGGPMTLGFHHLVARLGKAASMPFAVHPHICAMPAASSSPTMAMTPGRYSTTWATETSSTQSDTPSFRPLASGTSGDDHQIMSDRSKLASSRPRTASATPSNRTAIESGELIVILMDRKPLGAIMYRL